MSRFEPADELPHAAGPSSAWSESWEWRLVVPDASLAVAVAVVRTPAVGRVSYLASVVGRDRRAVGVVEHEIAAPRAGALELRASGIWADHVCEAPFSHWSLGLEAFGLTFDVPEDAVGHARGERTPVGLDLEWEDDRPAMAFGSDAGYLVAGCAHGEVLVGGEEHEVEGAGHRAHRWGTGARLPGWWGRASEVGPGAPPSGDAVGLGRAVADDGSGRIVEWRLTGPADGSSGAGLRSLSRD